MNDIKYFVIQTKYMTIDYWKFSKEDFDRYCKLEKDPTIKRITTDDAPSSIINQCHGYHFNLFLAERD